MKKLKLQKIAPYLFISSMLLSGCTKKVECNYPNSHVHLYIKNPNSSIAISSYFDCEYEEYNGFQRYDDYMDINTIDEEIYEEITRRCLFVGKDNFNYLYQVMASKHDYLMFYYEYDVEETIVEEDDDGNIVTRTEKRHYDGWHDNPYDSDNTGDTRLYHYRYYGYRFVYKDGKFVLQRSRLVDDIREILGEYPYISESCYDTVFERFKFNYYQLRNLKPEDFDTFMQPDLSNTTPYLGATKVK